MNFQLTFWFRCSLSLSDCCCRRCLSFYSRCVCGCDFSQIISYFCGFNCCFIIHTRTDTYKSRIYTHTFAHSPNSPKTTTTATTTTNSQFRSGFAFNEEFRRTFLSGRNSFCFSLFSMAFRCP